jgi:hypothetical protein
MEVQAGPGLKQDPISKITNAKGLEVWLKQYIACLARTSTIRKKKFWPLVSPGLSAGVGDLVLPRGRWQEAGGESESLCQGLTSSLQSFLICEMG